MKKQFLFALAIVAAGIGFTSCEKEELEQSNEQSEKTIMDNAPTVEMKVQPVNVAMIQTGGNELYFDVVENGGVVIREKVSEANSDKKSLLAELQDATPFDVFVAFTDATAAVPASIAQTATAEALAQANRPIDASNRYFESRDASLSAATSIETRSCYDLGEYNFRSQYCGLTPSNASDIRFCNPERWLSYTHGSIWSGSYVKCKRIWTYTNVICGVTTIQFKYWNYNQWQTAYSWQFPNGIWYAYWYYPDYNYRQVSRTASGGGNFRAYTRFYN